MKKRKKICFVSSSGGHYEQLRCLKPLLDKYDGFFATEKTGFNKVDAKYSLISTGSNDKLVLLKMCIMFFQAAIIWIKERPTCVVTTGSLICIPFWLLCRVFRKKIVYIETFARVHDGSKAGKFMYKHADLFIVQWESMLEVYPNAIYGGSIY